MILADEPTPEPEAPLTCSECHAVGSEPCHPTCPYYDKWLDDVEAATLADRYIDEAREDA